jgi:hypothetical protein
MHTKKRRNFIALFCLVSGLGLNACLFFSYSATRPRVTQSIYTLVAQTIEAESTLSSGFTAVAQLTRIAASASPTGSPTMVYLASPTASPTITTLPPTATPIPPTAIPIPPIYPTYIPVPPIYPTYIPIPPVPPPMPCDWAQYVNDVTVADGTRFSPGVEFTKVWRMRNIGSCTWTPYYSLTFTGGDRMQGYGFIPLPEVVYPGESVDIAVDLVAPSEPGRYRGYWMLRNPYGQVFGIGENAQTPFWVDIQVAPIIGNEYDFIDNMCDASWRNEDQHLPCPGNEHDSRGSVVLLEDPILETGKHENQPALWTRPKETHDGWISGIYTSYKVRPGDRFMADIGCLMNSPGCDVIFSLDYQIKGQAVKNLGSWREAYDGKLTRLIVDLSSLEGHSVQFILRVNNKGKPSTANAFWLVPSIQRSPPIPISGW